MVGRRKGGRAKSERAPDRRPAEPGPCPECGTRMAPTLSGLRCPRFGACGRGGLEETADKIPRLRKLALEAQRARGSVET